MKLQTLAIAAAGSLLVASTASPAVGAPHPADRSPVAAAAQSAHDARDLIKAIVFGQGPVVNQLKNEPGFGYIKEIQKAPAPADAKRAIETILDTIEANDPSAFDRYEEGLSSGDPFVVRATLDEASLAVQTAIESLQTSSDLMASAEDVEAATGVVVIAAVFHAAVAVTGAVIAGVVVVVAGGFWVYGAAAVAPADEAQFVADVTMTLGGRAG